VVCACLCGLCVFVCLLCSTLVTLLVFLRQVIICLFPVSLQSDSGAEVTIATVALYYLIFCQPVLLSKDLNGGKALIHDKKYSVIR